MKQGQVFSIDALIAGLVFMSILVGAFLLGDTMNDKSISSNQANDIEFVSRNAMNVLLESEGDPHNWSKFSDSDVTTSHIKVLGLSSKSSGILDLDKVQTLERLNATDYADYKVMLGLQQYDFFLTFDYWINDAFVNEFTIGSPVPSDVSRSSAHVRYALLNGTRTKMELTVWSS
jgi:hypothetical protein